MLFGHSPTSVRKTSPSLTSQQEKNIQHLGIILPSSHPKKERQTKRCFNLSCYGRKNNPALVQHTQPSEPFVKKIQISKTSHKIAISARDIKHHELCHMAVTHTRAHTHFLQSPEPLWMLLWMQHLERSLQEGRIGFLLLQNREGFGAFKMTNGYSRSFYSPPLAKLYFLSPS